ncbi:flavin-dependent oxidoreductase [uncultured Limnohabitans sp.]|jgi:5-methylphenazine-1-carboxylate 1-monooxygenase|uniref:flavin-dependent oxidoreductase n=1 Tax=uncultured Limnohabitans sp. TaxID=768543 RepID=UPI0026170F8A|nr:flavin-dependent oxidoreductase [uncultured Limnohabitans sp.]
MSVKSCGVAIVGGGVGGLALALHLHQRGVACEVFEAVEQVRELGVGITLLPHAMRELAALGLQPALEAAGIENYESAFFNRHGQFIYSELRGRHAGYALPEVGIHRGKLHKILFDAALARLGPEHVHTGHRFDRMVQTDESVNITFKDPQGQDLPTVCTRVLIASDGVNSAVRRLFYPDEKMVFTGINTWRGVTRFDPILTGKTYMRIGSIETGKMVIYPIVDKVDDEGRQLVNWMAEIRMEEGVTQNDWNRAGRKEDVLKLFEDWHFDWLDVPKLIAESESILEYPMVDKDPIAQWTFGRVTLLGDAAHPMYPRGSNGSAQALIDARTLADELAGVAAGEDPLPALHRYEAVRRPLTAKVVQTNRSTPPDFINIVVEERTKGEPFRHIDDVISQDELRKISDDYKKIAGFSLEALKTPA